MSEEDGAEFLEKVKERIEAHVVGAIEELVSLAAAFKFEGGEVSRLAKLAEGIKYKPATEVHFTECVGKYIGEQVAYIVTLGEKLGQPVGTISGIALDAERRLNEGRN